MVNPHAAAPRHPIAPTRSGGRIRGARPHRASAILAAIAALLVALLPATDATATTFPYPFNSSLTT